MKNKGSQAVGKRGPKPGTGGAPRRCIVPIKSRPTWKAIEATAREHTLTPGMALDALLPSPGLTLRLTITATANSAIADELEYIAWALRDGTQDWQGRTEGPQSSRVGLLSTQPKLISNKF